MKLFFPFFLFSLVCFCQIKVPKLEVGYTHLHDYANGPVLTFQARLILETGSSLYEMDHTNSFVSKSTNSSRSKEDEFSGNINISIASEQNEFVYKNIQNNLIVYEELIQFKHFHISESIPEIKWSLNNSQKDILGYECKRATTEFRGRQYEAFYAPDLAISNGPWLFHGLPGLILEVNSMNPDDLKIKIMAATINQIDQDSKIRNVHSDKQTISWPKFLELYRKKYDEVLRNNMTPDGPGYTLVKKGIMTYIED